MIIITGASRGVGKFLFDSYKKGDKNVIGIFNKTTPEDQDNLYKIDLLDLSQIEIFYNNVCNNLDEIVLINCAGITDAGFLHKSNNEDWQEVIKVNLFGTYNIVRQLLPKMRENNFGRIINFSSVVAEKSTPGVSAYATSKSALWGFAKSLAIENASKNITVNNINLGYSELGMIDKVPADFLQKIIDQIPMGRLCKGEEIKNTVDFIINTPYLNGSNINLNGGLI
jgi:NAD(P)-dependent dehydrogenase (short-subunit alcohol dehydrogenase family)